MRRDEKVDIGGDNGHQPLHSFRNLAPEQFYGDMAEEPTEPKPDDTPTNYISESTSSFSVIPSKLGKAGLTQRIFIDISKLEFQESTEELILGNRDLPAFKKHGHFESLIKDDNTKVIVVVGPTGSGKSTQFPQFALNAGYEVVKITQPRRAAADNVGNRIELEIIKATDNADDKPQVAIRTGGKKSGPSDAHITITTEGYLLTAWQNLEKEASDGKKIALILDEAHESSSDFEMLMALSKKYLKNNPESNLKIVVMSATLDAQFIAEYFDDIEGTEPALVEVEGRMFDVTKHEKPQSTIVNEAINAAKHIHLRKNPDSPNGVWVFVPGKREIKDTIDEIEARLPATIGSKTVVLPFHAKLTEKEQQAAFIHYPGVKIIVSTNAGETSITDPDCIHVIDSGLARQMLLDEEQVSGLERYHISKDEIIQRAGRTGRVCPGQYTLTRLNDSEEFIPFDLRDQSPIPEILRTDIVRHVLRTASFGYDIELLTEVPHPISHEVLDRAKDILKILGAFDTDYELTALGKRMNAFPASASSARMMAEADNYNQNTKAYMAAIVSCLEAGKLQYYAPDVEKRWQDLTEEDTSDLLAQLDIFIAIQNMTEQQMRDYDIDINNFLRATEQYKKITKISDAVIKELLPPTPQEKENLINCILAGSLQSIFLNDGGDKYRHLGDKSTRREISNRSLVRSNPRALVGDPYRAEYWRGGERREKHLIENATKTTLLALGNIATKNNSSISKWKHQEYILRDNKVMSRRGQWLFGEPLGVYEEAPARPSAELKEFIFNHALENPGPNQKILRKIKKETEQLSLRAGSHVAQLSQQQLEAIIKQAIADDLTDITQIDNNIRLIIEEQGICLDKFVSKKRREEIRAKAPLDMFIQNTLFKITYKASGPEIRIKTSDELAVLINHPHDVLLADGRVINFTYLGKKYTLHQLQETFGSHI